MNSERPLCRRCRERPRISKGGLCQECRQTKRDVLATLPLYGPPVKGWRGDSEKRRRLANAKRRRK